MQVHFFPSAMTIFKINSIKEICLFLWPKVLLKQRNRVAKSTPMHQRQKLGPNGLPEDLWTNKPNSAFSESLKKQTAPMTTSNDCFALCFHLTIQDLHFYQKKKKNRIFTLLQLIIALFEQYSEKINHSYENSTQYYHNWEEEEETSAIWQQQSLLTLHLSRRKDGFFNSHGPTFTPPYLPNKNKTNNNNNPTPKTPKPTGIQSINEN